jgi:glycosyltransferase involved in cell wall biosynthesis
MRILLVEPWLTGSHQAWAEGYQRSSDHEVDVIGLPGELWRWRLRGGALPLAQKITTWIDINGQPDLLLISGLVDVAELLGLARRNLSPDVGVVIYQHESQLVYPVADGNYDNGAALRNWMSWCVADLVLFNSYHHMRAVTDALPGFLQSLPDRTHEPMLDHVIGRFEVFPVGVDLAAVPAPDPLAGFDAAPTERPVILWPHRWERDKDPAAFLSALRKVDEAGLDFGLVLAGQDPPSGSTLAAEERAAAEREFADRIIASGELSRDEYLHHLAGCDLVVSCAKHEFFGIAVVEAVAAGCVPVLPNALSYPELIRPLWHSSVLYEPGSFGTRLVEAVKGIDQLRSEAVGLADSMRRFDWSTMAEVYDKRLASVSERLALPV